MGQEHQLGPHGPRMGGSRLQFGACRLPAPTHPEGSKLRPEEATPRLVRKTP
jgi:hypothetical protein